MEMYPGNHRAFCVRAYHRNGVSIIKAQRLYRAEFNVWSATIPFENRFTWFENTSSTIQIQNRGL